MKETTQYEASPIVDENIEFSFEEVPDLIQAIKSAQSIERLIALKRHAQLMLDGMPDGSDRNNAQKGLNDAINDAQAKFAGHNLDATPLSVQHETEPFFDSLSDENKKELVVGVADIFARGGTITIHDKNKLAKFKGNMMAKEYVIQQLRTFDITDPVVVEAQKRLVDELFSS